MLAGQERIYPIEPEFLELLLTSSCLAHPMAVLYWKQWYNNRENIWYLWHETCFHPELWQLTNFRIGIKLDRLDIPLILKTLVVPLWPVTQSHMCCIACNLGDIPGWNPSVWDSNMNVITQCFAWHTIPHYSSYSDYLCLCFDLVWMFLLEWIYRIHILLVLKRQELVGWSTLRKLTPHSFICGGSIRSACTQYFYLRRGACKQCNKITSQHIE